MKGFHHYHHHRHTSSSPTLRLLVPVIVIAIAIVIIVIVKLSLSLSLSLSLGLGLSLSLKLSLSLSSSLGLGLGLSERLSLCNLTRHLPLFNPIFPHGDVPKLQIPKQIRILGKFPSYQPVIDELESVQRAKRFADRLVPFEPGILHEALGYEPTHAISVLQSGLSDGDPEVKIDLARDFARVDPGESSDFVKVHLVPRLAADSGGRGRSNSHRKSVGGAAPCSSSKARRIQRERLEGVSLDVDV